MEKFMGLKPQRPGFKSQLFHVSDLTLTSVLTRLVNVNNRTDLVKLFAESKIIMCKKWLVHDTKSFLFLKNQLKW